VSESGGGIVVVGDEDAGTWKRTVGRSGVRVVLKPDVPLAPSEAQAVEAEAARLGAFLEKDVEVDVL
jgi:hypothetical protein